MPAIASGFASIIAATTERLLAPVLLLVRYLQYKLGGNKDTSLPRASSRLTLTMRGPWR